MTTTEERCQVTLCLSPAAAHLIRKTSAPQGHYATDLTLIPNRHLTLMILTLTLTVLQTLNPNHKPNHIPINSNL